MQFHEYGNPSAPTVLLLHGGGLSDWSVRPAAKLLQKDYFVVTPVIDGHGEDWKQEFCSIEDSAQKVICYLQEHCGGRVFAIAGLSLGAQIAAQVLTDAPNAAQFAVLESALVLPLPGLSSVETVYRLSAGLIQKKWFAHLQAKAMLLPATLFEDYFRDSCRMTLPTLCHIAQSNGDFHIAPTFCETTAKVLVLAGQKERRIMLRSAALLHAAISGSRMMILKDMHHGELSLRQPERYVALLREFWQEKQ